LAALFNDWKVNPYTMTEILEQEAARREGEAKAGQKQGVSRTVRHGTPEYGLLLKARFPQDAPHDDAFMFDGHRWRYEYTSFDDDGKFDVLWRPASAATPPAADATNAAVEVQLKLMSAEAEFQRKFVNAETARADALEKRAAELEAEACEITSQYLALSESQARLVDRVAELEAALRAIEWSNDSKWQQDAAKQALKRSAK